MDVFDGKQTSWEGIWWHPENQYYSSAAFNLAKIKEFKGNVRLYIKKNRYFNNGENGRPNYHFCIRSTESPSFNTLEIEEDPSYEFKDKIGLIEELRSVMEQGNNNADRMCLPSESQAVAAELQARAIAIIEELTGSEWNFSFLSFY